MTPRCCISSAALLLALAAPLLAAGLDSPPESSYGAEIAVHFELLENVVAGQERFRAALTLRNRGSAPLPATGWALYFNFLPVPEPASLDAPVTVVRVNGDLRRLAPAPGFEPLPPGAELRVVFTASGSLINDSAAPAGLYLVFGEGTDEASTAPLAGYTITPLPPENVRRAADDRVPVPTPVSRYVANARLVAPAEPIVPIVPTPVAFTPGHGALTLAGPVRIARPGALAEEADFLAAALSAWLTETPRPVAESEPAAIRLALGPVVAAGTRRRQGDAAYRLVVDTETGVEIVGTDPAGVFYGIQSLRGLLPPAGPVAAPLALPAARIEDAPRFAYRGVHLDVARNFQTPATVRKLIDLASFYKLNRFHFHLTDDEGWRLAIDGLPELVEVGGRRGHTASGLDHLPPSFGSGPDPRGGHGSGHYTRQELVEIVRHARRRHVEVVPEIDLPGHARAAIRAMESRAARLAGAGRSEEAAAYRLIDPEDRSVYRSVQGWDDNVVNVCLPSTYRFVERVVDELKAIWSEAGARLEAVHTGGDEVPHGVWEASPACARLLETDPAVASTADLPAYFLTRIGEILAAHGLVTAGWEEIALDSREGHGAPHKRPSTAALARGFRPYVWNNVWGWGAEDLGYRLANAGFEVVLANATNLYFDLAYENHPLEPGYAWAGFVDTRAAWGLEPFDIFADAEADLFGRPIPPSVRAGWQRLTESGRDSILGIQGQIWGENARGREGLEYLAFPKLLGLAERAWAARPAWAAESDPATRARRREAAWSEFAHRLGRRELPRLDRLAGGVAYRLPPPGAVVEHGLLRANVAFPGLTIRYTVDGGEPGVDSPTYDGEVAVGAAAVRLRTFDGRGRGSRTSLPPVEVVPSRPARARLGRGRCR